MNTTSRRSLLIGAAAVPVLAAPSISQAEAADPIFAAIERHRATYRRRLECGRVRSGTVDAKWSPDYDEPVYLAVETADKAAIKQSNDAAFALTTIPPTTIAGVLALARHVEAFNAGAFCLEPDADSTVADWQSGPCFWPNMPGEDDIDVFGYALLANMRRALEALAAVL